MAQKQTTTKGFLTGLMAGVAMGLTGSAYLINMQNDRPAPNDPFGHILTPQFMDRVSLAESSGGKNLISKKGNARGEFQFMPDTYLEQLYKKGPALGYSHLSNQIKRVVSRSGKESYVVENPKARAAILDTRITEPKLNRALARLYIQDGLITLNQKIPNFEEKVTPTVAYKVLHFGVGGAHDFVTAMDQSPRTKFDRVAGPGVCARNESICYKTTQTGGKIVQKPRTVEEVSALLSRKLDVDTLAMK